jgi:hypothetical protein
VLKTDVKQQWQPEIPVFYTHTSLTQHILYVDQVVIGITNIINVYTNSYAYTASTQEAQTIGDDHACVLMPVVTLMMSTSTA